ncbi:MAG TPA: hypothetical protein VHW00_05435 [Thermoanaerobaculia bacterium]|nr:hypothetical protein [Thermoanaerobaculia bacterium]
MTAPPDLARCAHCESLFAAAATDEVFFHATRGCCRRNAGRSPEKRVHQSITTPKRSLGN